MSNKKHWKGWQSRKIPEHTKFKVLNPNEVQLRGGVTYVCKVKTRHGNCDFKTSLRKEIRKHLIQYHGKEAPLREFYEVI